MFIFFCFGYEIVIKENCENLKQHGNDLLHETDCLQIIDMAKMNENVSENSCHDWKYDKQRVKVIDFKSFHCLKAIDKDKDSRNYFAHQ